MAQAGHTMGSTYGTRMDLMAKAWFLRALVVGVMAGALFLAGCGGGSKSSSSTTGATATQRVKRLEVTVVRPRAEAPAAARPFLARAAELLGWPRDAEAATCSVSAGGVGPVQTDASGKATLLNVPVDSSGNIPVAIDCSGVQSTVNVSATPNSVVAVTVEVEPGKVEVKAKSEHVSEPSVRQPSEPSPPDPRPTLEAEAELGQFEERFQLGHK